MKILAGDIGGTKSRLALVEIQGEKLIMSEEQHFSSKDFHSLEEVVHSYSSSESIEIEYAAFGVPGPVNKGVCATTNLPWTVDARRMEIELGFSRVGLINDLEAIAWGINALDADDFYTLNEGTRDASGNASIIAAGTGLGQAGLFWDGTKHRPFASEGGHADFSPSDDLEIKLLRFLRDKFGHVSWERVVSGPGLHNIHQFLCVHRGKEPPAWLTEMMEDDPAGAISRAALDESDSLCVEALSLFIRLYGAEAGNHALKIMARGGVYIGGGIAPKILEKLKGNLFIESFISKGRMEPLMRAMPVKVILNNRSALCGPAIFLAQRLSSALD